MWYYRVLGIKGNMFRVAEKILPCKGIIDCFFGVKKFSFPEMRYIQIEIVSF